MMICIQKEIQQEYHPVHRKKTTRIVLGGFGNVGSQIAGRLADDPDSEIVAIGARDVFKTSEKVKSLGMDIPVITADQAPEFNAVLVECATFEGFRAVVEPTLRAGGHVLAVSVGALSANMDLIDLTKAAGATLQIAGGTLPGLDIIRAASEGRIRSVTLTSHIHPASFAHEPFIKENGIDLGPSELGPIDILNGSARDAAKHFPRHFNVAVTLALAGIGLDRTQVHIKADGTLPGARHRLTVVSDAVELDMVSQNFPSPENNRTSQVVALSILAALRRLQGGLLIGS